MKAEFCGSTSAIIGNRVVQSSMFLFIFIEIGWYLVHWLKTHDYLDTKIGNRAVQLLLCLLILIENEWWLVHRLKNFKHQFKIQGVLLKCFWISITGRPYKELSMIPCQDQSLWWDNPFNPLPHGMENATQTTAAGNDRPSKKTIVAGNPCPPP